MPNLDVQQVVEAAARAIYNLGRCDGVSFEDAKLADFGHATALYRMDAASSEREARAALAVIVPAVTEQVRALHPGCDRPRHQCGLCHACSVEHPCPTARLLDELDAAARGEQP